MVPLSSRNRSGFIGHGGDGISKDFLNKRGGFYDQGRSRCANGKQWWDHQGCCRKGFDRLSQGSKRCLGTFSVAKRAAREGRNPQTGKKIKIKATKVVKFKAGSKLKGMVK